MAVCVISRRDCSSWQAVMALMCLICCCASKADEQDAKGAAADTYNHIKDFPRKFFEPWNVWRFRSTTKAVCQVSAGNAPSPTPTSTTTIPSCIGCLKSSCFQNCKCVSKFQVSLMQCLFIITAISVAFRVHLVCVFLLVHHCRRMKTLKQLFSCLKWPFDTGDAVCSVCVLSWHCQG